MTPRGLTRRAARLLVLALALACVVLRSSPARAESELARREDALREHMATKTMYPAPLPEQLANEDAANANEIVATFANNATGFVGDGDGLPSCVPIQLNFVIRHGTRYPTVKDIDRTAAAMDALRRGRVPERLQRWLSEWRNPYDTSRAGWLAPAGVFEQVSIGERLRARFGRGFHAPFRADAFVFEHTYKPRTLQSAMGFSHGFFGGVQPVHYTTDPVGEDHELRFFDNCPAFDHQIENNKSATAEHRAYRTNAQMQRNLRKFQQRAGGNEQLTQHDLEAAYAGCAFDVAVRATYDEWCALFNEEMLLSMDYFHDLKHFYKKSHGHAIAFEIAAPLLQDIYRSMLLRVQGNNQVQGHFRFAHAETILPLASLLNLSYFDRHANDREGHFLADTPLDVATRRSFRGSVLAPFSANIGFVLYECSGGAQSDHLAPTYRVQTLMHERTVRFSECGNQALCPFERFGDIFGQWIHEYDFFSKCAAEYS